MASLVSSSIAATGLPPVPAYLGIAKNEQAAVSKFARTDAQTKADIAYLQKRAPQLTGVDALMKDYRALGIVLNAFGMSDQLAYPGLVRQLITQDPTDPKSLAQRMGNAKYRRFAQAIGQYKGNPFADSANLNALVNTYALNQYEAAQGAQIPGMQDALVFKRQAAQVTSVAQLMSDKSLLKVALTETGLDYSTFGMMDYDRQVALLAKKIRFADFQNAKKVDGMAETYLIAAGQDPTAWGLSSSTLTVASLLGASDGTSMLSLFA